MLLWKICQIKIVRIITLYLPFAFILNKLKLLKLSVKISTIQNLKSKSKID